MEKTEAEAPPAAPAAAAPTLPGDAVCPCRRGGMWSSRCYWQMISVAMPWVCTAYDELLYSDRWYAMMMFIAIKY